MADGGTWAPPDPTKNEQFTQDTEIPFFANLHANHSILPAMLCEHSNRQQLVQFFACNVCEHLRVLCELDLRLCRCGRLRPEAFTHPTTSRDAEKRSCCFQMCSRSAKMVSGENTGFLLNAEGSLGHCRTKLSLGLLNWNLLFPVDLFCRVLKGAGSQSLVSVCQHTLSG